VSDYSVTQTTLEQIFQSFANLKFDESIQRYTLDRESGELIKTKQTARNNLRVPDEENKNSPVANPQQDVYTEVNESQTTQDSLLESSRD